MLAVNRKAKSVTSIIGLLFMLSLVSCEVEEQPVINNDVPVVIQVQELIASDIVTTLAEIDRQIGVTFHQGMRSVDRTSYQIDYDRIFDGSLSERRNYLDSIEFPDTDALIALMSRENEVGAELGEQLLAATKRLSATELEEFRTLFDAKYSKLIDVDPESLLPSAPADSD